MPFMITRSLNVVCLGKCNWEKFPLLKNKIISIQSIFINSKILLTIKFFKRSKEISNLFHFKPRKFSFTYLKT